ncbi:2,3-diaminopropionate biosynthesis protein SbnA [Luteococcus peritonei]|uniref:N-(2-amino-2-carboxyethyl)-L-glutamate synthase n=1 Tax=Luteococcus peritonei TaxID=88874 RepID=A0ABW4RTE4_9ACTN
MSSSARVHPSLSDAIGNTPVIALTRLFDRSDVSLFAKLEALNPGGSAKDRSAQGMLDDALATGRLRPGGTVVESSSGNLGVALARACTIAGVHFVCVVDSRANRSTVQTIQALGGEISLVSEPDPVTGDLLTARHARVRKLLTTIDGAISLDQYANPANPRAHRDGTMTELAQALDQDIDVLLVATSTTGTIGGCQAYLREHEMDTTLVAVDAQGSVLFDGTAGPRLLPGMGAGLVTRLSGQVQPDRVVRVSDAQCVAGCRALAAREGILAGASAGGVVWALGALLPELDAGAQVAVVLHDGGMAYLPTVYDDSWVHEQLGLDRPALDALVAELPRAGGA